LFFAIFVLDVERKPIATDLVGMYRRGKTASALSIALNDAARGKGAPERLKCAPVTSFKKVAF